MSVCPCKTKTIANFNDTQPSQITLTAVWLQGNGSIGKFIFGLTLAIFLATPKHINKPKKMMKFKPFVLYLSYG